MFTIKTNLKSHVDKDGRKYIIHPITKKRIYQFIPKLVENKKETIKPNLKIVDRLFQKINKDV
jgi:hypothetical protein